MENNEKHKSPDSETSKAGNPEADYNPTDRDFQREEGEVDSISESEKDLSDKPDQHAHYNPTNRDFQRTEEETDSISMSEKEESERTATANTKPDKDKIN